MRIIPSLMEASNRALDADLDANVTHKQPRDAQVRGELTIRHNNRGSGRGRAPLHRLIVELDNDNVYQVGTLIFEPVPGEVSIRHEHATTATNDSELADLVAAFYERVKDAETPWDTPDEPDELTEPHTSTQTPVAPARHAPRPTSASDTAAPVGTSALNPHFVEPVRARRVLNTGDEIIIKSTPDTPEQIPAGTRATIIMFQSDTHAICALKSTMFDPSNLVEVPYENIILVDDPSAELIPEPKDNS